MILGLDDIPGGTAFISFLFWIILTGLYYLVCYQAALNVLIGERSRGRNQQID
jgi:hypothetical protein